MAEQTFTPNPETPDLDTKATIRWLKETVKTLVDAEQYQDALKILHELSLFALQPGSIGPFVTPNGAQEWYLTGTENTSKQLHREDGPAIIYPDGTEVWYKEGQRHREDGPALTNKDGYEIWYKGGELHRVDGPAVVKDDDTQEWWVAGQRHREDGPAVITANGTQEWWQWGLKHRVNGPAVVKPDGTVEYWYLGYPAGSAPDRNGNFEPANPTVKTSMGDTDDYRVYGVLHREDGPAVVKEDGTQEWWVAGKRHREDGPAIIYPDGTEENWEHGKFKAN